jgi:hypothetical protein
MQQAKHYMAASVPRFLRQTKLSYLPPSTIIGSRLIQGDGGANLIFDIIMLPAFEFQRMKSHVGLQHVLAPTPQPGGSSFSPAFVLNDAKQVTVPTGEPDPAHYARQYFLIQFGLLQPECQPELTGEDEAETITWHDQFAAAAGKL